MTGMSTRGGREWTPDYLVAINPELCIGCGRCFKVCGRNVMELRGLDESGAFVEDEEEDEDEIVKRVMAMADTDACIGCGACARVCPTNCQTHAPAGGE